MIWVKYPIYFHHYIFNINYWCSEIISTNQNIGDSWKIKVISDKWNYNYKMHIKRSKKIQFKLYLYVKRKCIHSNRRKFVLNNNCLLHKWYRIQWNEPSMKLNINKEVVICIAKVKKKHIVIDFFQLLLHRRQKKITTQEITL